MMEYIMRYENEVLQLLPDKIQPLVRCKDCRFYKQSKHGKGYCIGSCDVLGYVDGDWFCADGVKKDA